MAVFWDIVLLAWLSQMLLNFLWVPMTAYAKELGLHVSFLGSVFALNVGVRFFPNLLVTQIGARAELPMMICVTTGFVVAYLRQTDLWAFQLLAVLAGMGFCRPCVTLHAQAASGGDVELLSASQRHCGAARSFADVCSFVVPSVLFDFVGWGGVMIFGASLSVTYILVALCRYLCAHMPIKEGAVTDAVGDIELAAKELLVEKPVSVSNIPWIDWTIAAAFVGTELQWNLLNAAVPAALVHSFGFRSSAVGTIVGFGSLFALGYLLALPSLPKAFNQHRPLNLLISYAGMAVAWLMMLLSLAAAQHPFHAHPSWWFVISVYFFLAMANSSQIVMLECLTGVCSMDSSTKIMGIAEMAGCAFGMAGSYFGEALLKHGMKVPFGICGVFGIVSAVVLALLLGHRHSEVSAKVEVLCKGAFQTESSGSGVLRSLRGLQTIIKSGTDYINMELAFRGGRSPHEIQTGV